MPRDSDQLRVHTDKAHLAVMLRSAQWAIDEGAFNIGAGRYSSEQQLALAEHLTTVADALRANLNTPVVIDAE